MLWVGCEGTENAINVDDKFLYDIALNKIIENEDQLHPGRMTKFADKWMIGQKKWIEAIESIIKRVLDQYSVHQMF